MADQHSNRPLTSPVPGILFDELCDQFELACQQGLHQSIEDSLSRWQENPAPLFRELLSLELEYRIDAGQVPTRKEYAARFSDHAALIKAVFSEVGIDEASRRPQRIEVTCSHGHRFFSLARLAGRKGQCPSCQETVAVSNCWVYWERGRLVRSIGPAILSLSVM